VLDEQEAVAGLIETGDRLFGSDAGPNEVERTVASGIRAGIEQPREIGAS
jgi:hypothetical protein